LIPHHTQIVPQIISTTVMLTRAATSPVSEFKCTLKDLHNIYPNETVLGKKSHAKLFRRPNGVTVMKEHLLDDPNPKDTWNEIQTTDRAESPLSN